MPSVITADPAVLAVTAPDGTPFVATTEAGPTLTGTVSSNTVTLTGAIGQIIKNIMVGTGAYFDGSMPWDGSWTGTPDNSTSLSTSYTPTPLVDDVNSPVTYRFTGNIAGNSVNFPAIGHALTPISAIDRSARLSSRAATFKAPGAQEILSTSPHGLWPLTEAQDSTSAGDISPNSLNPLELAGSGTAVVFGQDQMTGLSDLTGATFAGGQYLTSTFANGVGGYITFDTAAAALFRTTAAAKQTLLALADGYGPKWVISTTAAGKVEATWADPFDTLNWNARPTITGTITVNDGQPHVAALLTGWFAGAATLSLYVDGTLEGTIVPASAGYPYCTTLYVGGTPKLPKFTGAISHVAIWSETMPTTTGITEMAAAHLNGFNGEQTQDRLARYARWAGIPDNQIVLDADTSYMGTMAAIDTDGISPWDAMGMCETVEGGILSIDGAGRIRFRARGTDYNQAPTATIPAEMLRDSLEYVTDTANVVNDLTGERPGGATQRVINQASIDEFDVNEDSVTIPAADDQQVADQLAWRIFKQSEPQPRAEGLSVRLTQLDDTLTDAILLAEPGDRIDVAAGLPGQAPATTDSLIVQGWTETYSHSEVTWSADATPTPEPVWTIEDPLYGALDDGAVIAY